MRGMAAGEMDASAGACDSYAAGTGAKRLAPMFEPDIKTDGRNSARVLAASLLSSAGCHTLRPARSAARVHLPHPHSAHERMHLPFST